jgi:predicted PurR-regulated permease PerM
MAHDVETRSAELQRSRLQRNARVALIVGLIALGAWTLQSFLAALVWAAVIAIAIAPAYQRAERRWPPGPHNILLPLLFTTLVAVVFLLPFVLLVIQAARDAHDVVAFATDAMRTGIAEPDWIKSLPFGSTQLSEWWNANLSQASGLSELLHHFARRSAMVLPTREVGVAITRRVVTFFFCIVTLFFLLRSGKAFVDELLRASEKLLGPQGERIGRQVVSSVHGTVDGLVLVGLAEGVLLGIAFWIAGVPHPTLLGALSAVAAMIPFVVIVLLIVVGLVLLAQGAVAAAIGVVVFGIVMNFVADHFVRPGLIGGATKLPFIWVLLGVLGGVETWGLIGLFIGPALMSALILLWRELVRPEPVLEARPAPARKPIAPMPLAGE